MQYQVTYLLDGQRLVTYVDAPDAATAVATLLDASDRVTELLSVTPNAAPSNPPESMPA